MDGLSWEEFLKQIKYFLNLSLKLNEPWKLEGDTTIPGGAYITRKDVLSISSQNTPKNSENPDIFADPSVEVAYDPGEFLNDQCTASIWREIHVLYNVSYSAPHLLIRAGKSDGSLLGLEDLCSILPNASWSSEVHNNMWSSLTPCEHPLLLVPFYSLHPCHTQQWISEIATSLKPRNLLLSWLSAALPFLGLSLQPEYALLNENQQAEEN